MRRCFDRVEQRRQRRLREVRGVAVPIAAEVGLLVLGFDHFEDEREPIHPRHEGVVARLAEMRADLHDVRGLELLVADHQHRMVEERAMQLVPARAVEPRQVDPADLGAERSGERLDVHMAKFINSGTEPELVRALSPNSFLPLYDSPMAKRIAVVGAGALGGYVGGTLAHLGHDVTLIDAWPENVETIRSRGLE